MTTHLTRVRREDGIALILTLFLMMALSMVAASLMFVSQIDTTTSLNYRLMSQARYGAESGVQKAVNYLINAYTPPATGGADSIASYNATVSPVTFNGQPVVLSANAAVASNYPVAAVQNAFSAANQGTLAAGTTNITYAPYATLLSMQEFNVYGGGTRTIQTWQITSNASIAAGRTAQVEVTAILETQKVPAATYAAFGTAATCGAVTFSNNAVTDSYDSSMLVGGNPSIASSNGNVGTNGNLGVSNNATINGTLSTPRVGVGNCSSGNVTGATASNGATVTGGVVQLPQAITFASPAAPTPTPPTTAFNIDSTTTCAAFVATVLPPATCTGAPGNLTITPNGATITWGNVTVQNGTSLTLAGGTYNVNSITMQNNTTLAVGTGQVQLNVAGQGQTTPLVFTNNSLSNPSYDPARFQIQYGGTGTISLDNNTTMSAMIYAPNAALSLLNNGDFYGSILANTVSVTNNAHLHYDRSLSSKFFTNGNPMMTSFSWKKY